MPFRVEASSRTRAGETLGSMLMRKGLACAASAHPCGALSVSSADFAFEIKGLRTAAELNGSAGGHVDRPKGSLSTCPPGLTMTKWRVDDA